MLHWVMFRSLWSYRGFFFSMVKREFQLQYKGSFLGALWTIIQPLSLIVVFTLIFASVMKPSMPGQEGNPFAYSIYLCAGFTSWNLFQEILNRLNTVFIANANLIKKVNFPKIVLPAAAVASSLVNFSIIFMIFLGFLIFSGNMPWSVLWAVLPVLFVLVLFATGLGLLLGSLNVFVRDVAQVTGVVLQFWFWLTPIVYAPSTLSDSLSRWLSFNPMWAVISSLHQIFNHQSVPDFLSLVPLAVFSVFLLIVAGLVFVRLSGDMVDEL